MLYSSAVGMTKSYHSRSRIAYRVLSRSDNGVFLLLAEVTATSLFPFSSSSFQQGIVSLGHHPSQLTTTVYSTLEWGKKLFHTPPFSLSVSLSTDKYINKYIHIYLYSYFYIYGRCKSEKRSGSDR